MGGRAVIVTEAHRSAAAASIQSSRVRIQGSRSPSGRLADAVNVAGVSESTGAQWTVLDGYLFDAAYQSALIERGCRLATLDDYNVGGDHIGELVLDHNLGSGPSDYPDLEDGQTLLAGSRYCLLRAGFRAVAGEHRQLAPSVPRVLVSLGGVDQTRLLEHLVEEVASSITPPARITVLSPAMKRTRTNSASHGVSIDWKTFVEDMPGLLMSHDVAVSAAGSTTWELLCAGLGMVLFVQAKNQARVAQELSSRGLATVLGELSPALRDPNLSARLSRAIGRELERWRAAGAYSPRPDGYGADRVATHILGSRVRLRDAIESDASILLAWRNDPHTVSMSASCRVVTWGEHRSWLSQMLASPDVVMFVALDADDSPVGVVRFTPYSARSEEVHLAVAPAVRNRGLGGQMLRLALLRRSGQSSARSWTAVIRPGNVASRALFQEGGFRRVGRSSAESAGFERYVYVRKCG
jgi:spore coat polysaccharide biosynthesis predicted glycosyltransferase SpsG/L-amino acid N-acyltransferase YncA